ncbi:DUF58 domain-containing protein [Paucibacter sp. PLA-PC-4]|uniref:DUF58 domain-containing protein n=1 Tax=Paucibacter sp. PLA-PC-4 TaxID=2993655 RepID=UPI00224AEECB|nr:DUF58 domain-containing protein [Paucibacter sp. PLA-PC-4]MCX2865322.1 DUF58 domain-containing protein [Paucibacter sp. PLA-PC-4]
MVQSLRRRARAWWQARHPLSDTHQMGQRNIYILPSRPGVFYCMTLVVLLLASINDQLSLGYMLTFLLAGAGFASMHATHANLRGLSLDLKSPQPAFAGDDVQLEVRMHNSGRARYGIGIQVRHGKEAEPAWADVPAQGHSLLQLRCPAAVRGLMSLPQLRVWTRFPLGLFGAWSVWRPQARVWIYPRPEQPPPALPGQAASSGEGQRAATLMVHGQDFEGVRTYRQGDSIKQVLWKKAASTPDGQLLVRETLAPASRQRWLDLADTAGLDWEARLSRLTAWVLLAEQLGQSYGLRLGGQELAPGHGPAQRQACLELLAAAPLEPLR